MPVIPKRLIAALAIIFTIIFGYLFTLPKYEDLRSINLEIADVKLAIQQKEEYFSYLKDLSNQLAAHKDELAKIDSALPSVPEVPDLLNFVQKKATENGLIFKKIAGFSLAQKQKENYSKQIILDIELSGSYSALKNFLQAMEENSRLIKVETLSFGASKEKKDIFDFKIKLITQYFVP